MPMRSPRAAFGKFGGHFLQGVQTRGFEVACQHRSREVDGHDDVHAQSGAVWVLTSTPRGGSWLRSRRRWPPGGESTARGVFSTPSLRPARNRVCSIFSGTGTTDCPRHHRYPASRGMSSRSQKNPLLTSSKLVSDMFLLLFTLLLLLRLRGVLRSLGGAQGFDEFLGVLAVTLVFRCRGEHLGKFYQVGIQQQVA